MAIDAIVLVALIGGAASAIGSLISGLITILRENRRVEVTIQSKHGARVCLPANLSEKDIEELIKELRKLELDIKKIDIQ